MVLTQNQKNQLNKDILEYLVNNEYKKSAQTFAEESELSLTQVDPEGKKLQIKWKSILALQKKITVLEQQVKEMQQDLPKARKAGLNNEKVNVEDLYILKVPSKFQLKGHKATVTSLAFHPQFTQLASSSEDGSIKIWEFETGDFQRTLKGHTGSVSCVNYDPSGKYLVSCSNDLNVKLWDLNNDYQCCKTFYGHNHSAMTTQFHAPGIRPSNYGRFSTGYAKRTYAGHQNWVRSLAVTSDLKTMVSCSDDQSIIIWNVQKEAPVNRYFAHEHVIQCLLIVEGQSCAFLMQSDFLKHKFTQQNKINALKELQEQGSNGIANYHQPFLLTGSRDKSIRLFMLNTGQLLHTFVGHDNWVRSLALHPSGKYLYSASDDKTIRIWDLNFGKEKKKFQAAHQQFVSSIRFNNKYRVLASSGNDMIIKIWHLK